MTDVAGSASAVSEPGRLDPAELSTIERIRDAALTSFAAQGTTATSLRAVASAAGVSLGLVQHHFGTKAKLIEAVDEFVFGLLNAVTVRPVSAPPADSVADMSSRVSMLMGEHRDAVTYLGRALADGSPLGVKIFDALSASGVRRWSRRQENGELRDDIDITWAALNSLVLALGSATLRDHIERQVPGAFSDSLQLRRWEDSVTDLLRQGLFRAP